MATNKNQKSKVLRIFFTSFFISIELLIVLFLTHVYLSFYCIIFCYEMGKLGCWSLKLCKYMENTKIVLEWLNNGYDIKITFLDLIKS